MDAISVDRGSREYDVSLSFTGEDREYVEQVASGLRHQGVRVFYDRYEEANLWGKDLCVHLAAYQPPRVLCRAVDECGPPAACRFTSAPDKDPSWVRKPHPLRRGRTQIAEYVGDLYFAQPQPEAYGEERPGHCLLYTSRCV